MLLCVRGAGHGSRHNMLLAAWHDIFFLSVSLVHFIFVSCLKCSSPSLTCLFHSLQNCHIPINKKQVCCFLLLAPRLVQSVNFKSPEVTIADPPAPFFLNFYINSPHLNTPCLQTFNLGFRGIYHSGTSLLACICQSKLGADFCVYIRLERREKRRWPIW